MAMEYLSYSEYGNGCILIPWTFASKHKDDFFVHLKSTYKEKMKKSE